MGNLLFKTCRVFELLWQDSIPALEIFSIELWDEKVCCSTYLFYIVFGFQFNLSVQILRQMTAFKNNYAVPMLLNKSLLRL